MHLPLLQKELPRYNPYIYSGQNINALLCNGIEPKMHAKKPRGNNIICRLRQGKMEQKLLAYGQPKETVAAMMMLYRNTKVKVHSPDGDTDYFNIVAGVLQGDTLAPYLFIICLNYMLRTSTDKMKENGFKLTKERSRRSPAQTITNVDYADDIALLANAPTQTETLLHSL